MIREIDKNQISRGKLMTSRDLARLECGGCAGCSSCCRARGSLIVLDAWDVQKLKEGLNYSFTGLVENNLIQLSVIDGVVLPCLPVDEERDACAFLNEEGRCGIYNSRPGICRMFPLARIYHEDGSFSYFLQEGECERAGGAKIRISAWMGIENVKEYERQVRAYHDALVQLKKDCADAADTGEIVRLQQDFLKRWFA